MKKKKDLKKTLIKKNIDKIRSSGLTLDESENQDKHEESCNNMK